MHRVFLPALLLTAFSGAVNAQEAPVVAVQLSPHPAIPLAWDKTEITVRAGARVALTLNNMESAVRQPCNFVLVKPGKLDDIGAMATAMITDPRATEKHYIPEQTQDILAHTPLVEPGESATIEFVAPGVPGDYPYFCTFPGHWLQMRGILRVQP
jgi:azurin